VERFSILVSLGAYRAQFVEGQQGAAYISTNLANQVYNRNNEVLFKINYRYNYNFSFQVPFVKLKWMIKAGTKYLSNDGTWSTTETINARLIREFNKTDEFEIRALMPDNTTASDIEVRLYAVDPYEWDAIYDSTDIFTASGISGEDIDDFLGSGVALPNGYSALFAASNTITPSETDFFWYELQETDQAESLNDVLNVTATTRTAANFKWVRIDVQREVELGSFAFPNSSIDYIDASINIVPQSNDVPNEVFDSLTIVQTNKQTLDYDVFLLTADNSVPNGKNRLLNQFKDNSGTAISGWGSGDATNQFLINRMLGRLYKLPSRTLIISGYADVDIKPFTLMRFPTQNNRIYKWNRVEIDQKRNKFTGELSEMGSDTVVSLGEFNSDFNNDFVRS
jgi:hypothetical protein